MNLTTQMFTEYVHGENNIALSFSTSECHLCRHEHEDVISLQGRGFHQADQQIDPRKSGLSHSKAQQTLRTLAVP